MKTNKKIVFITMLLSAAGLTACSTLKTTVIPQAQNQYTVIATAEDESTVMNGAIKKAQTVCKNNQNKQLVVISHQTKYQGAGKTLGAVTNMVSEVAFAAGDLNSVASTKTAEDYKSIVVFKCQ